MRVLAIESSCDETAVAVVENFGLGARVLSSVVASSSEMHEKYGGIVPEVAAREQIKSIIPTIQEALSNGGIGFEDVEAIAVSAGPGLIGSLLVGVETAKTLAMVFNKPVIEVNHVAAHIYSSFLIKEEADLVPSMPALALVVSGGHTDLILLSSLSEWGWIGGTRDDAVGECFDKCARVLGLPYPGGPNIAKAATLANKDMPEEHLLPMPMLGDGLEMSFSGIKTAMIERVRKTNGEYVNELALELNQKVVRILRMKMERAMEMYSPASLIVCGGVAANTMLREQMKDLSKASDTPLFLPELSFCTDNAAMVGAMAVMNGEKKDLWEVVARSNWDIF